MWCHARICPKTGFVWTLFACKKLFNSFDSGSPQVVVVSLGYLLESRSRRWKVICILNKYVFIECWFRQEDLFRILKAYSVHNTTDGYCQAQAPIAAVLLMHMPAEQAFWCLVSICEKYLPGYYSAGLVSHSLYWDFGMNSYTEKPDVIIAVWHWILWYIFDEIVESKSWGKGPTSFPYCLEPGGE